MTCSAVEREHGYQCPVRGCEKRNNRRFSALGLAQHIIAIHGEEEFSKRLRATQKNRVR